MASPFSWALLVSSTRYAPSGSAYLGRQAPWSNNLELMKLDTVTLIRKSATALVVVAFAIGACWSAHKAGCTHNGAGATFESLDHHLVSTWLAIPSLVLFAALFMAPVAASLRRAALRAIALFVVAAPLTIATLMYIEAEADKECLAEKGKPPRFASFTRHSLDSNTNCNTCESRPCKLKAPSTTLPSLNVCALRASYPVAD
jgi:hypothetical protein